MLAGVFLLVAAVAVRAEPPTVQQRLSAALKTHPRADANGDGKLTRDEWRVYQRSRPYQKQRPRRPDALPPTKANVSYGPDARHRLDYFRAEADGPTPVLVCFHGGGFVAGDKSVYRRHPLVHACLREGISVVAANYRLIGGPNPTRFPGPLQDGARVVQFLRTQAKVLRIDPERIAVTGGSAGGWMALWIALHDDLADAAAADPVLRASSRVAAAVPYSAPTTGDPAWIQANIGGPLNYHPSFFKAFKLETEEDIQAPRIQALIRECGPATHVSADDPPLMLFYNGQPTTELTPADERIDIHSANFGVLIEKACREAKVRCTAYYGARQAPPNAAVNFLKQHLGLKR